MVTYGGMNRMPIKLGAGPLIFQDITMKGFWMSRWYENQQKELSLDSSVLNNSQSLTAQRHQMISDIVNWIFTGQLETFSQLVPFEEFQDALEPPSTHGFFPMKKILSFSQK